jgi:hypothetical protein
MIFRLRCSFWLLCVLGSIGTADVRVVLWCLGHSAIEENNSNEKCETIIIYRRSRQSGWSGQCQTTFLPVRTSFLFDSVFEKFWLRASAVGTNSFGPRPLRD